MRKRFSTLPSPHPKRPELNDNPVKLCNEIARIFRARRREGIDIEGVMTQPGAGLILSYLAIGDGITQLDLVNATHLKAPTVSIILKKMEEEGIVHREADKHDLRAMRVFLTDYGRELDAANIANIKELDAMALDGISESEQATLMLLLTKIRDNLIKTQIGGKDA